MRTTTSVVNELFSEMRSTVKSYGSGVIEVGATIEGTSFFPGGSGLWRGLTPNGALPEFFPAAPVLVLGHNFDSVKGHEASRLRGVERLNQGTWKFLLGYLSRAELNPAACFFTNVFVGLQPEKAVGDMLANEAFKGECREFLKRQLEIVRPRLVVILGSPASEQFDLLQSTVRSVSLLHPSYLIYKSSQDRERLIAEAGDKVKAVLACSSSS